MSGKNETDVRASGVRTVLAAVRRSIFVHIDNLWGKYRVPMEALQQERNAATAELATILDRLGYVGK